MQIGTIVGQLRLAPGPLKAEVSFGGDSIFLETSPKLRRAAMSHMLTFIACVLAGVFYCESFALYPRSIEGGGELWQGFHIPQDISETPLRRNEPHADPYRLCACRFVLLQASCGLYQVY